MKLFVECEVSKKNGKKYFVLCADLGYRTVPLCFDINICSELTETSIKDLFSLNEGDTLGVNL